MLENKFYKILKRRVENDVVVFDVELLKDCDVYQGHFPGEPVAPGVCNIQMLKECAEKVAEKHLIMNNLKQARLTTLVTPLQHQFCEVKIKIEQLDDEHLKVHASLGNEDAVYLELKSEMKCII